MKSDFIGKLPVVLFIIVSVFLANSLAGSRRRLNGSKGDKDTGGRGIHGFYDDPNLFDYQIPNPIVHRESYSNTDHEDSTNKAISKDKDKDKDAAARTCTDAATVVTPSFFDLSSLFSSSSSSTSTGSTGDWFGIGTGIAGIAIVLGVIWIKAIVAAFIAWIWWAGYGGSGGGKYGSNDNGYSYSSASSEYGAPVQPSYGTPVQPSYGTPVQPSYGAPVQPSYGTPVQPSYGPPPQPQYGTPSSAYSSSRSLSDSFNFERISDYIVKAIETFAELHKSTSRENVQQSKNVNDG